VEVFEIATVIGDVLLAAEIAMAWARMSKSIASTRFSASIQPGKKASGNV
jgi:hypothetical protein